MKKSRTGKSGDYKKHLFESLKNTDEMVAYINAALDESDDPDALLVALRHVAQAHNKSELAEKAGLHRVTLYRILSKEGNPSLENLEAILDAMNLTLRVEKKAA